MPEESNFQHAPPGLRRSGNGPQAALPEGVEAPGKRKGRKEGPEAEVPQQYIGPDGPEGSLLVLTLFMFGVGITQLVKVPDSSGVLAFAVGFTLAGLVGCYAWVQAWLAYRRAWHFEWRLWSKPKDRPFTKGWWRR